MNRIFALVLLIASLTSSSVFADELNSSESRKALEKIVNDYIGMYRQETLDQWKNLFHPSVIVVFPGEDGGINVRNREEFVARQKNFFSKSKSISERLENVQIFEGKRMARLIADFILVDEGAEHAGKLGLHLVEGNDGWKIVAVLFSYNSR
jgi:hypothetical protein